MGTHPERLKNADCDRSEPLKIRLTRGAQIELDLLGQLRSGSSGFLSGRDIGRYRVIDRFIHFPLKNRSLQAAYHTVYQKLGDRLIGVFFVNETVVQDDWLIGDIILSIAGGKREVLALWPPGGGGVGPGNEENFFKVCDL